jgi:hypothetical protein
MNRNLQGRVERLESDARMGDSEFTLEGGARAAVKMRELPDAIFEAVTNQKTFRASVLLHATSAKDGSQIHSLCQALAAGPIKKKETSPNEII